MIPSRPTEIRLLGILGEKYGRRHKVFLDTHSPAEAMRWLLSQFCDARAFFAAAHQRGIAFTIFRGRAAYRENIGEAQLSEPAGGTIVIAPVIVGSKNGGVFQVILGIVLIALSYFDSGLTAQQGAALLASGIGLAAGGIVQLLSPQPKVSKNADSSQNQASYVFSGAVNTTAVGNPYPLLYGRMICGSAVGSAGIEADDYTPATAGTGVGTPAGSFKRTPYDQES